MHVKEREPGDLARLRALARKEKDAHQKDRYLSAAHAIDGMETPEIVRVLVRPRRFVQAWAYAYRDGGIGAIKDKRVGGSKPRLAREHEGRLRERLKAGPTPADKVCTLRGRDIQRIIRDELGTDLGLSAVYNTLHRLGYSCLAPRPRHEKHDPEAQRKFREESAPFLSAP